MSDPVVAELLIYPVKSCAAIKVNEAKTTKYGLSLTTNSLLSDRRWMVVKNRKQQTLRQISKMALIQPSFTGEGLILNAPGMPRLQLSLKSLPDEIIEVECWETPILGRKYPENVSQWLSEFLETPNLDLVYFDDQFEPRLSKDVEKEPNECRPTDVVSYHDMSPVHLLTYESVDDLNKRLENPVKDYWRQIQIGSAKLIWIRQCLRCLLPTVNPENGIRDPSTEPWKTYRLKKELYGVQCQFGTYLGVEEDGILHVGDEIKILREDKNF
ncbi:unnamed protein product [Didymodactylos carnosus]|uniref:MOSC domain-containing protein n=1 Tax=Didymodactylos carnosus TaxID=1234261 RepID=A0A815RXA9_9BILA|nr:unnamed protein product [Didymodactylos carnosus]CAF1481522.1 unnamed protein product [Didymodactylos carnosus]CAF4016385.1 unnamed protein product [Didymodactylos carnosus]CAF4346467.1 unnamed protein product [Didymodactylos carnosus]